MAEASNQVPAWATLTVLAAISCGVNFNTIQAGFTYDDFFAVIKNTDVTDDDKPLVDLLLNDFWGTPVKSPTSHKSYRPLTILSFRLQRRIGNQLLRWIGWTKVYRLHDSSGNELDPLPFHICNVFMHAVVTYLVYLLALRLCVARDSLVVPSTAAAGSGLHREGDPAEGFGTGTKQPKKRKGGADTGLRQRRSSANAEQIVFGGGNHKASGGALLGGWSSRQQAEAFLAATIFAVHPIHAEAVAGIVGHAELICAAFSIVAVLLYAKAADLWVNRTAGQKGEGDAFGRELLHWVMAVGAMLCIWAASLAKEIGITVTATIVLYDAFLVPFDRVQPSGSGGKFNVAERIWRQLCTRKGLRIILAGATLVLYVRFRSFLAVDQLVRIYREVENPVAFASGLTKVLSLAHLHGQYAALMVAPVQMCADWSYRCVPLVEHLSDWRNLLGAATYGWLACMLLLGRPWEVVLEGLYGPQKAVGLVRWGSASSLDGAGLEGGAGSRSVRATHQEATLARRRRRWQCFVATGLIVMPFLPASNLFFWVGTYIGERLLYAPSIGYCILLADLVAWLAGDALPSLLVLWREPAGHLKDEGVKSGKRGYGLRATGAAVCLVLLLAWYSWRTFDRNWDWEDEERLFRSALKVCPRSAKVQLNMGITERRYYNWDGALEHFHEAQRLATPGFCEPLYWIGVTRINAGQDVARGAQELEDSLACPHTATDAALALNKIYSTMQEKSPQGGLFLKRWARVLLRPELRHIEPACDALEQALIGRVSDPVPADEDIALTMQPCLEYLANPVDHTELETQDALAALRVCIEARMVLMSVLSRNDPASLPAKTAGYAYISKFGPTCRYQHLPPEYVRAAMLKARADRQPPPEVPEPEASQGHVYLMHRLHAADPEDGFLQREWGEVLVSEGRPADAAVHLEVAGKQMVKLISSLVRANLSIGINEETGHVGELTAEQLTLAATTSFDRAVQVGTKYPCRVYHQMCEVQAVLSQVFFERGQQQLADEKMDTAQRCMAAVAAIDLCRSYVQELVRMQGLLQHGAEEEPPIGYRPARNF